MKPMLRATTLFFLCLFVFVSKDAAQQEQKENYVKAHYTKYEYRIPMRDGKRLFTAVYVPKDMSQAYPFLMERTPYSVGPYGVDRYREKLAWSEDFEKAGYIFVFQDVRGRYMSEGQFLEMSPHRDDKKSMKDVDESTDTYDTIEFLLKNIPNNNGKVGIWGISYPGFFTSASIIDSHPALKAASPQAPMTDLFMGDDAYHGGAFMLAANFGFYTGFKPILEPSPPKATLPFDFVTPDGYKFFLGAGSLRNLNKLYLNDSNPLFTDQILHDTYDEYWKQRDLSRHMNNIRCAVLTVGGWFDAEDLAGPIRTFQAIKHNNPSTPNMLVEGPWTHGGWNSNDGDHLGDVQFAAKTSEFFRTNIQFPFFEYYLKGKGSPLPNAYVFETGTNVWRKYDSWPPSKAQSKVLYLHSSGSLSFEPPSENEGLDEYVSDPARPVPFINYIATAVPQRYMVDDQRFAARRTDVLTYQTPALEDDITVSGPISPELYVTSTGTDSDFVVKIIDVYPDDYPDNEVAVTNKRVLGPPSVRMGGYQQLLRGWPMRAKFRNSWEKPEALIPGKVAKLEFTMPDINHTFRKGHRIMVQIQSSWFPLIDRNPQTFVQIPDAKTEDFKKATEQVIHRRSAASRIELMVLGQ
jgi:putative CocE/NonD family hydrolase